MSKEYELLNREELEEFLSAELPSALVIERSEKFCELAKKASELINSLDLPADKHNALVKILVAQNSEGEQFAFQQGFRFGFRLGRDPEFKDFQEDTQAAESK